VHKIPDLVDFCVTKGIPPDFAVAHSCPNLSSDHSPVLVTLTSQIRPDPPPSLSNRLTNYDYFKHLISERLLLQIPLKTTDDIEEAVKFFTDTVQWAGWKATPPLAARHGISACPLIIQEQLTAKRKLRRDWHHFRTPKSKRLLNAATQNFKQLIHAIKNDQVQTFLQELTATAATDYSLWKATKNLKRVTHPSTSLRTHLGSWANSNFDKAHALAHHLSEIFQPHPSENLPADGEAFIQLLETPYQLEPLSLAFVVLTYKQSPIQKILWLRPNHSPHP
jgi:hypothetical protein